MELNIVNQILEPYLKEKGLILYDVNLIKEGGNLILQVLLDKTGGIDIKDLEEANGYLSEKLDKYDSDMPEYMLEVSSPGAEKELRNENDIKESIGQYIHVEVPNMIYEGVLIDYTQEELTMKINAKGRFKNVKIDPKTISLIRLAVKI